MDPENSPTGPVSAASILARLVDRIDASGEQERRALLEAFLSAAWGCRRALDQ
jgi:hypothetical protein